MEQRTRSLDLRAGLTQSWRVVRTLWLAEIAFVGAVWLVLSLLVPRPRADGAGEVIALIFYALGLADIPVGWWLRERTFAAARNAWAAHGQEAVGRIVGLSLVAVTLALTPAVLGVVLYIALGNRTSLSVLCVLSLIGLVLLRPRLDQWYEVLKI